MCSERNSQLNVVCTAKLHKWKADFWFLVLHVRRLKAAIPSWQQEKAKRLKNQQLFFHFWEKSGHSTKWRPQDWRGREGTQGGTTHWSRELVLQSAAGTSVRVGKSDYDQWNDGRPVGIILRNKNSREPINGPHKYCQIDQFNHSVTANIREKVLMPPAREGRKDLFWNAPVCSVLFRICLQGKLPR